MTSKVSVVSFVKELQTCFGGYWRYPEVVDYYYLVNPYFPPRKLAAEFKNAFYDLLTQYPSGMRVNSSLAAKNFHVDASRIVVGNGASELIASLMKTVRGKCGFIYPSFEEYPNRLPVRQRVPYYLEGVDYRYSASDIINFFGQRNHKVGTIAIVNPDNPSGNLIARRDMLCLIEWTKAQAIRLLVDESFVDFSDKPYSLISNKVLKDNPHLVVIKSISKSYGVPGLRLGVDASGDTELIAWMKKDVAIWNVNSFAEFYMQIAPKYTKDFRLAYEQFRKERSRFLGRLLESRILRVIPSQANYFLAEVLPPYTAKTFVEKMFRVGKVLIKDCSNKKALEGKDFIRITIRSTHANNLFLEAPSKLK